MMQHPCGLLVPFARGDITDCVREYCGCVAGTAVQSCALQCSVLQERTAHSRTVRSSTERCVCIAHLNTEMHEGYMQQACHAVSCRTGCDSTAQCTALHNPTMQYYFIPHSLCTVSATLCGAGSLRRSYDGALLVLCCAVPSCAVHAVLRHAMLGCAGGSRRHQDGASMLCCATLCYAVLCCAGGLRRRCDGALLCRRSCLR